MRGKDRGDLWPGTAGSGKLMGQVGQRNEAAEWCASGMQCPWMT